MRHHASFLHLPHLLNQDITLHLIGLLEGLWAQVWTGYILHARLGHVPRHLLKLIEFLVEDAHLLS